MPDKRVSSLPSSFFDNGGSYDSHEEQNYKRKFTLALIHKGPGTKALLTATQGAQFTFDGIKLVEGEYYLGIPRSLVETQYLGGHNFVLWLYTNGYPRWVERMVYNGHIRCGLSECWEKHLSWNATAEEKAEYADAGSTSLLPVSALLFMSAVFGLLFGLGVYLLRSGHESAVATFFAFIGIFAGIGMVRFAAMAIWKWDRDRFWRALDVINSLDLRRPPDDNK